ncbi:hypothetical protein B0I33_101627 [Prauserella shujinwangii]|uniref:Uncharacterized protein n=1 Tax=Prauserella shujinwangii TaxID=1453103 RepID=A0A2T0M402_9PSEU|nr:hypothetical protein [Prauserella shujinwangii]PRX51473.1 hypothetical protein B0I33_101627 [Prauserella shujinwangii]
MSSTRTSRPGTRRTATGVHPVVFSHPADDEPAGHEPATTRWARAALARALDTPFSEQAATPV